MNARRLSFMVLGAATLATPTFAQVPDLLNALDAGGRAMGIGGSLYPTSSDTLSPYYNPAGLGFVNERTVGAVYRNLPRSSSTASGQLEDPDLDTRGTAGNREITHFGAVFPFGKGALGISYTVGGFVDDFRQGSVNIGPDPVTNYAERFRSKTDFFTVAYGTASGDGSFSWGAGVQFVQNSLRDQRQGSITSGGNLNADVSGSAFGLGGIIGVQFNPRGSNISYGLSYRTEVNLSDNDQTSPLLDKIPARLMAGVALRQDGVRNGKDFIVYGASLQHFFKVNNGSNIFNRKDQNVFGFGAEYNYDMNGARVPLRLGYNFAQGGGLGYGDRNTLTFGVGYRPANSDFVVDLNLASPQRGGFDLALSLGLKLK